VGKGRENDRGMEDRNGCTEGTKGRGGSENGKGGTVADGMVGEGDGAKKGQKKFPFFVRVILGWTVHGQPPTISGLGPRLDINLR
jgi:hypothetical protein